MGMIHCVCNYNKTIENEWPTMKGKRGQGPCALFSLETCHPFLSITFQHNSSLLSEYILYTGQGSEDSHKSKRLTLKLRNLNR